MAKIARTAKTAKTAARKGGKAHTAVEPKTHNYRSERRIEPGPRGFRFSEKWIESVKNLDGVAVHPTNIAKLKAHAKELGVSAAGKDPLAIAQNIKAAL